jgi:hypothetical protein
MAQPKKPKPSPDEQLMNEYLRQLDNTPSQQQVTCSRQHYQWMAQQINTLRRGAEIRKESKRDGET